MSELQRYIIHTEHIRSNVLRAVQQIELPHDGIKPLVVEIKPLTRTIAQNARMWAMLTDVSNQVVWHGRRLDREDWKNIFSAALKRQDVVPNIDGTGFVVLGQSTSKMSVKEMADMIELITAFGVDHGVVFGDE